MVTQKKLKEILHYNKNTGIFTFLKRRGNKKAGSVAGHNEEGWYTRIYIHGKSYYGHRLAWLYVYGELPQNQIDHINHDKQDNRIANLRLATHQENSCNRPMQSNNTSGVVGVSWSNRKSKWIAQIKVKQKNIFLGYFSLLEDARVARINAERLYNFHKNHGIDRKI